MITTVGELKEELKRYKNDQKVLLMIDDGLFAAINTVDTDGDDPTVLISGVTVA